MCRRVESEERSHCSSTRSRRVDRPTDTAAARQRDKQPVVPFVPRPQFAPLRSAAGIPTCGRLTHRTRYGIRELLCPNNLRLAAFGGTAGIVQISVAARGRLPYQARLQRDSSALPSSNAPNGVPDVVGALGLRIGQPRPQPSLCRATVPARRQRPAMSSYERIRAAWS